jgi:hypothetical protein
MDVGPGCLALTASSAVADLAWWVLARLLLRVVPGCRAAAPDGGLLRLVELGGGSAGGVPGPSTLFHLWPQIIERVGLAFCVQVGVGGLAGP